jgi:hypothetical protein
MAKSKIFWYYYFFIALPVFGFMFLFWEPASNEEQYPEIYKDIDTQISKIESGTYDLHDIGTSTIIGKMSLEVNAKERVLKLDIEGKKTRGIFSYGEWEYDFKKISKSNMVLKPIIIGDHLIWLNEKDESAYALYLVKNDWFNIEKYQNSEGLIFMFSAVPTSEIKFLKSTDIHIATNEIIYNSANEYFYSGLIIMPKSDE